MGARGRGQWVSRYKWHKYLHFMSGFSWVPIRKYVERSETEPSVSLHKATDCKTNLGSSLLNGHWRRGKRKVKGWSCAVERLGWRSQILTFVILHKETFTTSCGARVNIMQERGAKGTTRGATRRRVTRPPSPRRGWRPLESLERLRRSAGPINTLRTPQYIPAQAAGFVFAKCDKSRSFWCYSLLLYTTVDTNLIIFKA